MSELNLITKLMDWYSQQCNGEWEHGSGIDITTIDNPGWMMKVNLRETPLEAAKFEPIGVRKSEDDWIHCQKRDSEFVGAGDPSKLPLILEHFLKFAGQL
jgi:hypothetical protein